MTRIQIARLRAQRTKRALAASAAVGFLAVVLLARDSHAGNTGAVGSTTPASDTGVASSYNDYAPSDSGSFGAPTGAPQVQSSVS
jgi:hypothetical protein